MEDHGVKTPCTCKWFMQLWRRPGAARGGQRFYVIVCLVIVCDVIVHYVQRGSAGTCCVMLHYDVAWLWLVQCDHFDGFEVLHGITR